MKKILIRILQALTVDQSMVVDKDAGEWQCGCPSTPGFNKSINPKWVSACAACGRRRP